MKTHMEARDKAISDPAGMMSKSYPCVQRVAMA